MKSSLPAANPEAYVAALAGWRLELVTHLRAAARASAALEEVIKWGHLVYLSNGPVLLIRTEPERVLFGFWRGQRLRVQRGLGLHRLLHRERPGVRTAAEHDSHPVRPQRSDLRSVHQRQCVQQPGALRVRRHRLQREHQLRDRHRFVSVKRRRRRSGKHQNGASKPELRKDM